MIEMNKPSIEELQAVNQELRESEESYRIVAETASDAIIKIDEDSTILFVNHSVQRIFGYTVEEMLGRSLTMIMPEDLREKHRVGFRRYLETGIRYLSWESIELPARHADGHIFPLEISFGEYNEEGKRFFIGIARDISERKRAEETLLERERLALFNSDIGQALIRNISLSEVLHSCTDSIVKHLDAAFARIWTLNKDKKVLELQASSGIYTHLDGEHAHIPVGQFKIGRIAEERQPHLTNWVVGDEPASNQEWAEREGMVAFADYPLIVEERLVGVVAMFARQPLTAQTLEALASVANTIALGIERKRAEEALRESEERFRTMADNIAQFAWMADSSGWIFWYNRRWFDYTGTTLEEMQGWDWQTVLHPDEIERVVEKFKRHIASGEAWEDMFPLRSKDGEYRWFLSRALPIRDAEGKIERWFGTNTDIEEVRRADEKLKDADRRKDEFLATLAHELRNPLAPIRTGLEIMRYGTDAEQMRAAQSKIERQITHIVRLVDDLLDVSRITQGKIDLQTKRLELREAIDLAVETTHPQIGAAGHKLEIKLPDEPVYLDADLTRLAQIFLNLLSNAAKYSEPNGKISIVAEYGENQVVVCVSDTGLGITPDKLPHIFGMFTQIERSAKRGQGGLGIGLSLVKSLTEMHGGTVEAASAGEGKGSSFKVRLPLAKNQRQSAAAVGRKKQAEQKPAKEPVSVEPKSHKILVVDDNTDAAGLMEVLLTLEGNNVLSAYNGESAVKIAIEHRPEVILLDIGLPDIDGYEAARRIRQKLPKVLLIALTGWGQDEDRQRSREAGFDHHLVKPVEIDTLKNLIAAIR